MQIFYAPDITGNEYYLDANESKHCIRVLRMQKGTPLRLIDGKGNLFDTVIVDPDPGRCLLSVTAVTRNFEVRQYRLHIAISPLKNYDRLEWFVEKSVELGIDEITPVICQNTEKPGIKKDRLHNIVISAMKQSLKSTLTRINDPCTITDFIRINRAGCKMIAHCRQEPERSKISEIYLRGTDAVILIGPEGDFTGDEIINALSCGYTPVHLGSSRLRSETAGVAACHSVYFINQ